MDPRIFICFRKSDQRAVRKRIHHTLVDAFGADQVFKSGSSIRPGTSFAEVLTTQAARCDAMLVLIGPQWAALTAADGGRLLDREDDWVRVEIETALRSGSKVIPVLIGDAAMLPGALELPASLAPLGGFQFLRIEESRTEAGLAELVSHLRELFPELRGAEDSRGPEASRPSGDKQARGLSQKARAEDGGISVNIGGGMGNGARITGGNDQSVAHRRQRGNPTR